MSIYLDVEKASTEEFAARVQAITNVSAAGPFSDRLAIGALYDAYGRDFADAGSMASFKERIVEAFTRKLISLRRLDDRTLWSPEDLARCQVQFRDYRFHFVAKA